MSILEEPMRDVPVEGLMPFQVKSWRIFALTDVRVDRSSPVTEWLGSFRLRHNDLVSIDLVAIQQVQRPREKTEVAGFGFQS